MKLLILALLASIVVTLPFLVLRKPWAIMLWRRAKLVAMIYAVVILASAIVRLVFNWGDIYG